MWSTRYWSTRYWASRYWSRGITATVGLMLEIDGTDRTGLLQLTPALNYTDRQNGRQSIRFRLLLKGPPPYTPSFLVGHSIRLFNGTTLVFAGSVENISDEERVKGVGIFLNFECVDHTAIFDRYLAIKILNSQTAGSMIKDLVSDFIPAAEGISTGDVQDGLTVERAVFGYRKMSSVMNDLSRISGFMWFVDNSKSLQFFTRGTFLAPFGLSDGSANYRKIRVVRRREQYSNRWFIRAGEDTTDARNEDFQGDTERRTFTLAFKLAELPTVTLNAGAQTVGVRGIDDESAFDWLWRKGEKEITQGSGGTTLTGTDVLSVTYKGLFPIVVLDEDTLEIAARVLIEGGAGIYEDVEDDDSIESRDLALQKAAGNLRRWANIPEVVRFETDTDGLRAGQLININLPNLNLNGDFLIDEVRAKDLKSIKLRYNIVALSGEHLGSWHDFFRKLQDAGKTFKLDADETLGIIRTFKEGVNANEAFNTTDALGAFSGDPYTGMQWGKASSPRGTWGGTVFSDQVTTGGKWTNPPVDA